MNVWVSHPIKLATRIYYYELNIKSERIAIIILNITSVSWSCFEIMEEKDSRVSNNNLISMEE